MASMKQKSTAVRSVKTKEAPEAEAKTSPHQHAGDVLREAREARNLSIDAIADELMIRRFYLEALEAGSFKDLPERVYAIGFVKNYANYLGIGSDVIEQFKRDAYGSRSMNNYQVELSMPEAVAHSVVPGRSAMISAVVILLVLIGGIVFATQSSKKTSLTSIPEPGPVQESTVTQPNPADQKNEAAVAAATVETTTPAPEFSGTVPANTNAAAPAVPAVTTTTPAATETTANATATTTAPAAAPTEFVTSSGEAPAVTETAAPAATPATAEAAKTETPAAPAAEAAAQKPASDVNPAIANIKNHRVLEATQSSWVEVKDAKGGVLFTSILKKGQMLPLPDNAKILLTTGNAGGLRMIVDGKVQGPFGQQNEVKRNIPLEASAALEQR